MGICHNNSYTCSPFYKISFAKVLELVNRPARYFPKAITIAPVKVESSNMVFTL